MGQFQIMEELGKGGMATVYKAYQLNLQRHVAIKVLSPKLTDDMSLVKRFQREARSAAAMHHPNVIVVYDADRFYDPENPDVEPWEWDYE